MSGLYVEYRELSPTTSLAWDIAHHLYVRHLHGRVVVVTDEPVILLSAVSKQWHKVVRQVERERSSTLASGRIRELTRQLTTMQLMNFVVNAASKTATYDVRFVTPAQAREAPPRCQTLYIVTKLDKANLSTVTKHMPAHSLIVLY